jgi:hypothetical protein
VFQAAFQKEKRQHWKTIKTTSLFAVMFVGKFSVVDSRWKRNKTIIVRLRPSLTQKKENPKP